MGDVKGLAAYVSSGRPSASTWSSIAVVGLLVLTPVRGFQQPGFVSAPPCSSSSSSLAMRQLPPLRATPTCTKVRSTFLHPGEERAGGSSRWRAATTSLLCSKEEGGGGHGEDSAASQLLPDIAELEALFEARIAEVAPAMLEALNKGPGAIAVMDNVLGREHTLAMRREAVAVTEQGLLQGSASAYSTAPPQTFEERYGDEPGISASVLTPGTVAGEMAPICGAYITAASRVLSRVLSGARRGDMEPSLEGEGGPTDHQLRLTTVAQQVHMDNSFDGVNRRLLTTLYYLNPNWQPEHGGRFLPWPCSDAQAGDDARAATLPSTVLSFDELPAEAQAQIPAQARDRIRVSISRKLAPSAAYEAAIAGEGRGGQLPVEPLGDRLVAFYADELLHSVEPVTTNPLVREGNSLRVRDDGRFAISLWLPAPKVDAILPVNPAHEWLAKLSDEEAQDPIGGTLQIEMAEVGAAGAGKGEAKAGGFGGAGSKGGGAKKAKKAGKKKGKK